MTEDVFLLLAGICGLCLALGTLGWLMERKEWRRW